ncbi:DUF1614 domain-containing protein [Lyngbya confervoides]|uniref:DUF1614 domain-containing protein n=1 Tax=Lyngbya confervoides BDU141951 TaxID=1574623 RepID=A0ABD4T0D7_9CYAN|nr:DUF1614 domain-containing protein [Lyngbya confervoides]MCM1982034.1 DUF1614 domain-containing protein [Lyngbya confervoides BDU141951]
MIYLPVSLFIFLLFLLLILPLLWVAITLDIVQFAAGKLGFSPSVAFGLLILSLLGSAINLPLYQVETEIHLVPDLLSVYERFFWRLPLRQVQQVTIVALNVGGGLIPVLLALYQFTQTPAVAILLVTAIVTTVSYYSAHIVPGIGIQMSPLVAPVTAALSAFVILPAQASSVAFAGGILGTVMGADLLHLKDLEQMSAGVLSIGGAGVFDGIALCGLMALLLT